jgi:hypothetical protein
MSSPQGNKKQLEKIKEIENKLAYDFDAYEVGLNGLLLNLYGKPWSIALQISLLNALHKLLGFSGEIDLKEWMKETEKYFENKELKLANGKNPIKKLSLKIDAKSKDYIFTELGYKKLDIFIELKDSNDEYEFSVIAQNDQEVVKFFYRWINQFIYDLSRPIVEVVGQDLDAAIRLKPGGDVLQIYLSSILGSPFQKKEKLANGKFFNYGIKKISIPYPKKLTYTEIRNACGGDNGIYWGHHNCRGWILPDDHRSLKESRQLLVSGDSPQSAEQNYERFLKFTSGSETNRRHGRNDMKYDDVRRRLGRSYLVYPKHIFVEKTAYFRLSEENLIEGEVRTISQGQKRSKKYTISIYSQYEHPDFKNAMEILRK